MAITMGERPGSRSFTGSNDSPSRTDLYWIKGTADETEVTAHVLLWVSPFVVQGGGIVLYRQPEIAINHQGYDLWHVDVPYGKFNKAVGSFSFEFDGMGGTHTAYYSKETVARFPAGGDKTQFGGGINVQGAGDGPKGVEVVSPQLKLIYKFTHPAGYVNEAYAYALSEKVGCFNSKIWRGIPAGAALFMGPRGGQGTDSPASVTYEFGVSRNVQNETISGIANVNKRGWDVAWPYAKPADVGGKPGREIDSIFVERVYDPLDFSTFFGF